MQQGATTARALAGFDSPMTSRLLGKDAHPARLQLELDGRPVTLDEVHGTAWLRVIIVIGEHRKRLRELTDADLLVLDQAAAPERFPRPRPN